MPRPRVCVLAALVSSLLCASAARATDYSVLVLQALTGPAAFIGTGIKDGMLLAVDDINKKQLLGPGNSLKVTTEDDASDRTQTVTLVGRYAADPKILAIMGPTSGAVAPSGGSAGNDAKIPTYATANSLDVLKTGPWAFILTQPGVVSIPYIGDYSVETLKVKNCATIGINDIEAYTTLTKLYADYVTAHGVKIVSQEAFKVSESDFAAIATKVAALDIDCVFLSAPAPQSANLVRQLREAGLDPKVRIIGHSSLASPDLIAKGGAAVEGVYLFGDWVPGGNSDEARAFDAAFKARTGSAPDNWGAIGYSAMFVLANAIKNAGPNPTRETLRAALTSTKDVPVVIGEGRYSFDADRVPHYGSIVLVVKNGQFVVAPK